jgi:hypothetical protein
MTLPKAISDAMFAYLGALTSVGHQVGPAAIQMALDESKDALAALERAIADHVSPVEAPTEAEIEAWRKDADSVPFSGDGVLRIIGQQCIEQAVALMRRAAAAKPEPFYSCTGRAFRLHSADWHGSQDEMPKSVLVYGSGDMGRGEFANYLRADVAREAAATPAPSALERLREREAGHG